MKEKIQSKKHADFRVLITANRRRLIDAGIDESTICRWANGTRIPGQEYAIKISLALDVPISNIPYRVAIIT